ncbi:MAG: nitroreductase, partial [Thermoleophilia bacterium]|nr:nitroreductase [Thermoleophilia bacterium]
MPAAKRAPQPGAEDLTEHLRDRWSVSVFDPAHELADA